VVSDEIDVNMISVVCTSALGKRVLFFFKGMHPILQSRATAGNFVEVSERRFTNIGLF